MTGTPSTPANAPDFGDHDDSLIEVAQARQKRNRVPSTLAIVGLGILTVIAPRSVPGLTPPM